ncbi:MAG: hypothetical protein HND48_08880 [Chloroflexi bacterium]|nr:hypothetical protein [Chloroflexota bacterium]
MRLDTRARRFSSACGRCRWRPNIASRSTAIRRICATGSTIPKAGASVATMFLAEFVDYPVWAHVDMAGTFVDLRGQRVHSGERYVRIRGASADAIRH